MRRHRRLPPTQRLHRQRNHRRSITFTCDGLRVDAASRRLPGRSRLRSDSVHGTTPEPGSIWTATQPPARSVIRDGYVVIAPTVRRLAPYPGSTWTPAEDFPLLATRLFCQRIPASIPGASISPDFARRLLSPGGCSAMPRTCSPRSRRAAAGEGSGFGEIASVAGAQAPGGYPVSPWDGPICRCPTRR